VLMHYDRIACILLRVMMVLSAVLMAFQPG
jgi:hypothetical protein